MPVGIYKRKQYTLYCATCNKDYVVKQRKVRLNICPSCASKIDGTVYYRNHKEYWKRWHATHRKQHNLMCNRSYVKNKEKRLDKMKQWYKLNRSVVLAKKTLQRRERGELPRGYGGFEIKIAKFLEPILGTEYILCSREVIQPYELDIYYPHISFAIEVQGAGHQKPIYGLAKFKITQKNDAIKRKLCKVKGIRLLELILTDGIHYERKKESLKLQKYVVRRVTRFRRDNVRL